MFAEVLCRLQPGRAGVFGAYLGACGIGPPGPESRSAKGMFDAVWSARPHSPRLPGRLDIHVGEEGINFMRRLCVALPLMLLAMLAAAAPAVASKEYVLKHPTHEHCRTHYVKKSKTIKKRVHGQTEKLHETVCVYVAPKSTTGAPSTQPVSTPTPTYTPTPAPTPAPNPIATVTQLEVGPAEECINENLGFATVNLCYFEVSASVGSAEGVALGPPTFTFTNESEPGKTWTVSGKASFRLEITVERSASIEVTSAVIRSPTFQSIGSTAHGIGRWAVSASYAGSSQYAPSQSSSHTFVISLS